MHTACVCPDSHLQCYAAVTYRPSLWTITSLRKPLGLGRYPNLPQHSSPRRRLHYTVTSIILSTTHVFRFPKKESSISTTTAKKSHRLHPLQLRTPFHLLHHPVFYRLHRRVFHPRNQLHPEIARPPPSRLVLHPEIARPPPSRLVSNRSGKKRVPSEMFNARHPSQQTNVKLLRRAAHA